LYETLKDVFRTERYSHQNGAHWAEKAVQARGTRLAKGEFVKVRYTYRNIILVFGICVALIVILTLWAQHRRSTFALSGHVTTILSETEGPSFLEIVRKTTLVDF
jgi:hypothetical protein